MSHQTISDGKKKNDEKQRLKYIKISFGAYLVNIVWGNQQQVQNFPDSLLKSHMNFALHSTIDV